MLYAIGQYTLKALLYATGQYTLNCMLYAIGQYMLNSMLYANPRVHPLLQDCQYEWPLTVPPLPLHP